MFSFILMLSSIPKQMLQNKQKEIDWNKWENLSTFAIRLFKIPVIFQYINIAIETLKCLSMFK